jgi:glycosyltransferase involved in cell wall biosynthesis
MNNKLKICYIIGYFQPEKGYEEYYSAYNLVRLGHNVSVITSDRIAPFKGLELKDRRRNIGLSCFNGINIYRLRSLEFYTDMIFIFGLFKTLYKLKPDVIHCHTTVQFPSLISVFFSKILKIRCVIDCHEFNYKGFQLNPIHTNLKSFFVKYEFILFRSVLAKLSLYLSDKIISVAPVCTEFLIQFYKVPKSKIFELNLSVDTSTFYFNKNSRECIRKKFSLKEDDFLFIYSGIFAKRKKIEKYIELFSLLSSRHYLLLVLNISKEDLFVLNEAIIINNVSNRVFIELNVNSSDMFKYFSASDFGIWLYNNSVSYLEAMACSLPVLISKMQLSYLTDENCSVLVDLNEVDNFEYISKVISELSLEDSKVKGNNSRNLVLDKYSYSFYSSNLERLYYSLL